MILDARSIGAGTTVEADVCLVGSGTAGITMAREFIGRPFQVCLLESGGLTPDPATQSLAFGDNIGFPYYPLDTLGGRFFGGSSNRWHVEMGPNRLGARLRPLDPLDFEPRDWVPFSGWPFTREHLEPYYDRAQQVCQVEPVTFDAGHWSDPASRPLLPLHGDEVQTIIYKIGDREPFVRRYPDEVTRAGNITTWLHAHVLEIETNDAADHVTAVRVGTLGGPGFRVAAKVFIVAAGGIEAPRLLLLSNRRRPAGLGNDHDLVGRFFMEHPHFWAGVLLPRDAGLLRSTGLYNGVHLVDGVAILGKLALSEAALRREKLLNHNVQLIPWLPSDPREPLSRWGSLPPLPPAVASLKALKPLLRGRRVSGVGRHIGQVVGGLDDVVAALARKDWKRILGAHRAPAFVLANMMEQVPNPDSRVTLGERLDQFGQRRAQLEWRITTQDVRSARRTQEIIGAAWERAGLGRHSPGLHGDAPHPGTHGGYHQMGTTRMHDDPKQGVVDARCRVHGIGNLFVAGPSVFPTGGYANPVLTLVALALRLADDVKARLG